VKIILRFAVAFRRNAMFFNCN